MSSYRLQALHRWMRVGRALAAATPVLLVACGGGGGDGDPVNTNTYDLNAVITRAYTSGVNFPGLSATAANGVVMTMNLSMAPAADALFEGAVRKAALQTITLSAPGVPTETTWANVYYGTGPYRAYGSIDEMGAYTVSTSTGNLSTAARVGDAGPLNTDVVYADAGKATVTGQVTTTWEVVGDGTTTTAWVCAKSVMQEVGVPDTATQSTCFRINTAGEVLAAKMTLVTAVGTFEFK